MAAFFFRRQVLGGFRFFVIQVTAGKPLPPYLLTIGTKRSCRINRREGMPKTVLIAIATLLLAVAALVTDVISPYAGNLNGVATPVQVQQEPRQAPLRVAPKHEIRDIAFISSHPMS